jgi:hypothetical protein
VAVCHSPALFKELPGVQLVFREHHGFAVHQSKPDVALDGRLVVGNADCNNFVLAERLAELLQARRLKREPSGAGALTFDTLTEPNTPVISQRRKSRRQHGAQGQTTSSQVSVPSRCAWSLSSHMPALMCTLDEPEKGCASGTAVAVNDDVS